MSMNETWGLISLAIACVLLSAFFSSAEAAYLSLQKSRISHLATTLHPGAIRVSKMIQTPENLLFTILLANNLVNVAFAAIVTAIIVDKIGEALGVIIATFFGSMPSMFVTVALGSGIESVIDQNTELSFLSVIISPEIYLPISGLFIILIFAFIIKKIYFKN